MASQKILAEKQAYVAELQKKLTEAASGVIVSYSGISVADDTKLRRELREAGIEYEVIKNTMLRLAVKGTSLEGLAESFKGDTAVAVSTEDPIAPARILQKYVEADKSKRFSIKSGYIDGSVLDAAKMSQVAKLPDRTGMLSMFAGAMSGTLSSLAVAMQAALDKMEEPAA